MKIIKIEEKPVQHDSDCSTNNRGCPELLGPCNCTINETSSGISFDKKCGQYRGSDGKFMKRIDCQPDLEDPI